MGGADRPGRGWNVAHIARRTTTDGHARWDVRWQALGVWQAKTFRRRQDADAFRRSIEARELRSVVVDVRQTSGRLGAFATEWLATRRRPDSRPLALGTQALYADVLRRHIIPTFGQAKLVAIRPAEVRRWYGATTDRTSPLQAAKAYRLLRTILNTAVRDGILATNPCNIGPDVVIGQSQAPRRTAATTRRMTAGTHGSISARAHSRSPSTSPTASNARANP